MLLCAISADRLRCRRRRRRSWAEAFTPASALEVEPFWSGNLPTLSLAGDTVPGSTAAGVSRVFYMSSLTVVAQLRTNLPLIFKKVRRMYSVLFSVCRCEHTVFGVFCFSAL